MKIALLHQAKEPPTVDGIRKPMKPNGYRDSSADIAYTLQANGYEIITPTQNPDIYNDNDWSFPDTFDGISKSIEMGADTIWLNTVLYKKHPIMEFDGLNVIGQNPFDVDVFDDKFMINQMLRDKNYPIISETIIKNVSEYKLGYPCVLKPIRGRGSQGVYVCHNKHELQTNFKHCINKQIYGEYMMIEPFLSGQEITIAVFPNGEVLPPVHRYNHQNDIAPYNGEVEVIKNSCVINTMTPQLDEICNSCGNAVKELNLKSLCRIDCRADSRGKFYMFDINMKPNMTGAGRPHRMEQDSLVMISAKKLGWSYNDLLVKMVNTRWKINSI